MQSSPAEPKSQCIDHIDIEPILDYIEHFDDKGIQLVFLMTPSRCGITLVHSLLDNHRQILQIPVHHFPFMRCSHPRLDLQSTDAMVEALFKDKQLSIRKRRLGPEGDQVLNLPVARLAALMKQLLPRLSRLDQRSFMLTYFFSYAHLTQMDFREIKLILSHEHLTPGYCRIIPPAFPRLDGIPLADLMAVHTRSMLEYSRQGDPYLAHLLAPFPNARLLIPIRSPMATLYHRIRELTDNTGPDSRRLLKYDIGYAFTMLYEPILNYYWVYAMMRHNPERVDFIHFEAIHTDVAGTMAKLAARLGIQYQESMTRTTFGGKMWKAIELTSFGYPPMPDTHPERLERENAWKAELDPQLMRQCYTLCKPLYDWFDSDPGFSQAPIPMEVDWTCLDAMMPIEQDIYDRFPETVKHHYLAQLKAQAETMFPEPNQDFESFYAQWEAKRASADRRFQEAMTDWETYPAMRMRTLQYLKQAQADWAGTSVRDLAP